MTRKPSTRKIERTEDELRYFERQLREAVNACVKVSDYIAGMNLSMGQAEASSQRLKIGTSLASMHTVLAEKLEKMR